MAEKNAPPERRWGTRRREAAIVQWLGFSAIAAAFWLLLLTVSAVLDFLGLFHPAWHIKIYTAATLFFSLIETFLYRLDKRAAKKEKSRVPERVLLIVAGLGGWPGALVSAPLFRHKTKKISYRLKLGGVITVHLLLILIAAYVRFND